MIIYRVYENDLELTPNDGYKSEQRAIDLCRSAHDKALVSNDYRIEEIQVDDEGNEEVIATSEIDF